MSELVIKLLGAPRFERDGQPLQISNRKAVALLAYLAVTGVPHTRDTLATLFWPEGDRPHGLGALRFTLVQLKNALGDEWLAISREQVGLARASQMDIDVVRMRQLLANAKTRLRETQQLDADSIERLQEAVQLYQGQLLAGFGLSDSPAFDDWLLFEGESLVQAQAEALAMLTTAYRTAGDFGAAINTTQRWLALDSLDEQVNQLLIELYIANNQRATARRHYAAFAQLLEKELGVSPDPELAELLEQSTDDEPTSHFATLTTAIAQSAQQAAQQATQPNGGATPSWQLAIPQTPLLGRDVELAEIARDLADPSCRLLTLVGAGGSGKTHLALLTASTLQAHFPHGIYFVSLVAATSRQQVIGAIADGLQLTFQSAQLTETLLVDYLRARHLLLILDNFEHLMDATALVETILHSAPKVTVLVTSRERLNLHGEQLYSLDGLQVPPINSPLDEIAEYGAVQLFVQSAQRGARDFVLDETNKVHVAQIVRLLDGLPLAIELAAAWVRLFSCQSIVEEIERNRDFLTSPYRNFPQRHRSMRSVFDYSWQLASPVEQAALRQLSLFAGSFDREAAARVSGVALTDLLALLDKSLLQSNGNSRFRWHPLLRQFALERLEPTEREQFWQRYFGYYLGLLNTWSDTVLGGKQKQTLQAIDQELDNIQLLLRSVDAESNLAGPDIDTEMAFYTLFQFYRIRGRLEEFIEASNVGLARLQSQNTQASQPTDTTMPPVYWHLLAYQACALVYTARYDLAAAHFQRVMTHLPSDRYPFVRAISKQYLGILAVHAGDFAVALHYYVESLAAYETLNAKQLQADVLNSLGVVNNDMGDFAAAIGYLEQSIVRHREAGHPAGMVYALSNRAASAYNLELYVESRRYVLEALEVASDMQFLPGIVLCLASLADIANSLREYSTALVHGTEALALTLQTRDPRQAVWVRAALGIAELGLDNPAAAHEHFCRGIAAGLAIKAVPRTLEALVALAHWQNYVGELEDAVEVLGFCMNHPNLQRKVRDRATRLLAQLRQRLDAKSIDAALARGQSKSMDEITSKVLAEYNTSTKQPLTLATSTAW